MSESEIVEGTDVETKYTHPSKKRIRHRKKQLYENILKQMEFYFSDANLTKDRYLGELIKNDPYVPLEVFLKFNKLRALSQDMMDIAKAMKHSSILELSEDKLKVKRKSPVVPYDSDARTVYVESIPVTASRDWLQKVFSDYGTIAYISLPKFKNSQKIKGFGFVEFAKPEDAQTCLNAFTKMGCKLPTCMPPEELSSIKMFSIEESPKENCKKEAKQEYEPAKKKPKKKEKKLNKNLELKLENDSDSEKKLDTPTEEKFVSTPTDEEKYTDAESKDELTSQDESKPERDTPRKRKKTRKRSSKDKAKSNLSTTEAPKGALWGLQVLSKSEWKSLRNKYLNLQRKYMKEIKYNLQNKRTAYSSIPAPAAPSVVTESVMNPQDAGNNKSIPPLEKIPGVFVKEILSEPCLDVKHTKRNIKTNEHALHVDVKEGQCEVIIRFDSAKAANEYCADSSKRARVLRGTEEEEQWTRAEAARANRRPRGRCRLLARRGDDTAAPMAPASPQPTHTHIRFDE